MEGRLAAEIPTLRTLLRRLASGTAGLDPEDLLQETMRRALRYQDAYDPAQPLGAWLHGIGFRVFLEQRARLQREPRALGEAAAVVATAEDRRVPDLAPLLARLDAAEREAVERFHLRGESIAAIACSMRAAEGTVKSWLHRARHKLAARARREDWL